MICGHQICLFCIKFHYYSISISPSNTNQGPTVAMIVWQWDLYLPIYTNTTAVCPIDASGQVYFIQHSAISFHSILPVVSQENDLTYKGRLLLLYFLYKARKMACAHVAVGRSCFLTVFFQYISNNCFGSSIYFFRHF